MCLLAAKTLEISHFKSIQQFSRKVIRKIIKTGTICVNKFSVFFFFFGLKYARLNRIFVFGVIGKFENFTDYENRL